MAEFIIVNEEKKIDSNLPLNIRLGEGLENENILIFDQDFSFFNETTDLFANCCDKISFDFKNSKQYVGNKEKHIPKKIKAFLEKSFHDIQAYICKMFPFYSSSLISSLVSFVPSLEKAPKDLPLLLHHFNYHPVNGDRVLTFCINIDIKKPFHIVTSKVVFESMAKKAVLQYQFPLPSRREKTLKEKIGNKMRALSEKMGFNLSPTSPYDTFMFRLYKFLEGKKDFQSEADIMKNPIKSRQSCMFFADSVPHYFESDCSHLIFSFYLPRYSLLNPEKAPISILERMSKEVMKDAKMAYFK